jgi:predicted esterase
VALELALRHHGHKALGSCVALSAALMSNDDRQRTEGPHTPVLLTRGALDDIVTEGAMTATVAALLQAAPTCGAHVVVAPGKEHAMPRSAAEMRPVMEFWSHTLRVRPPAADDETLVELT